MSNILGHSDIGAPVIGRRCIAALIVAIANIGAILYCYAFDALNIFGSVNKLSCTSLGLTARVCTDLEGHAIPRPLLLPLIVIAIVITLGIYDPRPLLLRLEQSRRSRWWLALNAAGVAIFVSPYLLAAFGVPLSSFVPFSPYLLCLGALVAGSGLLWWLSDAEQLDGTIKLHHVLVVLALFLGIFGLRVLQDIGWGVPALQAATFNTTVFFLQLLAQPVISNPDQSIIGVANYEVSVAGPCSGIAGILMVSAVMTGYTVVNRNRLNVGRALLLIPFAAFLSWLFNGVRIATLLMVGAYISPELAGDGFHTNAGWLIFCFLSASMLVAAENIRWIHRRTSPASVSATPLLHDPVVAQIAPFVVLLVSSLLLGAIFVQPEAGYPLRAILMAGAVLLFWKSYRAEIGAVDAVPVHGGILVAVVWLGVKAESSPLTIADILGPVSGSAVILWISFRIFGTVFLVPFIEEMFFRGYLLRRLNFGGRAGKMTALTVTSVLFGALHSNLWLAAASGLLFGLLALRRGRVFDAVAAHTIANAIIAAWALWTGDWSVI